MEMTKAARSVLVFGIYLIIFGLSLIVFPNTVLIIFNIEPTNEPWIRILGMMMLLIGYFYVQSARSNIERVFIITVQTRTTVIFFLAALIILKMASPILILFGIIDLIGAIWTYVNIRSEKNKRTTNQAL